MGSEKKKKKDKKHKSRCKHVESETAGQHNTEDIVLLNSNLVTTEPDNVFKTKKKKKKIKETSSKTEESSDKLRQKNTPDCDNENRNYPERGSENKRTKRKKNESEVEESENEARRHKKRTKHSHDSQSDAESDNIDTFKRIRRTESSDPECPATERREHCISENSGSNDDISVDLEPNGRGSVRLVDDDDSVDFEDDDYLIKGSGKNKTSNSSNDDWFKGLPIISCFPAYMEQKPSTGPNKLTFWAVRKATKTYEEMLCKFPPGIGVPDDQIEEIPEKYDFWKYSKTVFPDSKQLSMEDVAEELENKIDGLCDYFQRLESGRLTAKELKRKKQPDLEGVFLPTPEDIEFFENLEIKITWPLSSLDKLCMRSSVYNITNALRELNRKANMKGFSPNEKKIVLSNWRKFQQEYQFYDLRPLLKIRTHRLRRTHDGDIEFTRWKYLSTPTEAAFGLYLARGLKDRTAFSAISCLRRMMSWIDKSDDFQFYIPQEHTTSKDIAMLEYLLRKFGNCWQAMEAILGRCNEKSYISRFYCFIWQRNIKLRIGPWTEAEKERLKLGLFTELGVSSLAEAFEKRHFPFMKLMPYVKTRSRQQVRGFLTYWSGPGFFTCVGHEFKHENRIKLIDLVYRSDYEEDSHIQWEEVADHFPGIDKYIVKRAFMDMYYKVPLTIRQKNFEAAKQYLYDHVRFSYINMVKIQEQGALNAANKNQLTRQDQTRQKFEFKKLESEDSEEIKEESEDPVEIEEELFPTLDTSDSDEEADDDDTWYSVT